MIKEKVKKVFEKIKEKAGLDFAVPQALGDCGSCTWAEIDNRYGKDAKGIWLKYFTFGMNKEKWNKERNFISHNLTDEQKKIVKEELDKYFVVEWDMSDLQCITIKNKVKEI